MKCFRFANRTNWPLEDNTIIKAYQDLKAADVPIINLIESNPSRCNFNIPSDIFSALNSEENKNYTPDARGMLKAREVIVNYYKEQGVDVSPEQIFLTSSSSEAYSYLYRLLANQGEEVLFPRPSYPLFQFLVDLNDLTMFSYSLSYDNKWAIDLAELESIISSKTKAITLVNPNNPTGSYVHIDELNKINAICKEYNMSIICDEVFFLISFLRMIKKK